MINGSTTHLGVPLAALLLTCFMGGCTQTEGIRQKAQDLARQITSYEAQQKDRVDRLNAEYRDRFNELMDDLVALTDKQLDQNRDSDSQVLADALTANDNTSLIGDLRSKFATTMVKQRDAIATADQAVTAARAAYVKAYSDASLDLAKLDKVKQDLTVLGTKETVQNLLKDANGIIKNVIDTHNQLVKSAKSGQTIPG